MTDHPGERFPRGTTNAELLMQVERPRFSICSVVNRPAQYAEMVKSFKAGGFTAEAGCEYLYLDNSTENNYEPYSAYNLFLRMARGQYVILCHQDVFLIEDGFDKLNRIIEELNEHDPDWGLFGNSGGYWPWGRAIRIRDKVGDDQRCGGPFPRRSHSLDENFVVVRADANLALSKDLKGFHLYATELCLVAAALGHSSYVVDFYLYHAGEAKMDRTYYLIRSAMIRKYSRNLRMRVLRTPCSDLVFTWWGPLTWLANTETGLKISFFLSRIFGGPPAASEKLSF
jgi:glycosyltransferase involved in cell wall biosynthesis